MEKIPFFVFAEKEFAFLLDTYGFRIVQETYEPEHFGDASILFKSDQVGIVIILDRGQVLLKIGKVSQMIEDWFEVTDVIRFFSSDHTMDVYKFSTVNPYDLPSSENQLSRLAALVNKHCGPMLRGDFSMETELRNK